MRFFFSIFFNIEVASSVFDLEGKNKIRFEGFESFNPSGVMNGN